MINDAAYVEAKRVMDKFDKMLSPDKKWSHGKPPDAGDENDDMVYLAVAKALSAWERFEGSLSDFYLFLTSRSFADDDAKRDFGSLKNPTEKFKVLDGAFEAFAKHHQLEEVDAKRFNRLLRHFKKAAFMRNDIAHGVVTGATAQDVHRGHFLVPAPHDSEKNAPRPPDWKYDDEKPFDGWGWKFRFNAAAIDQYAAGFNDLRAATLDYQYALEVKLHPKQA